MGSNDNSEKRIPASVFKYVSLLSLIGLVLGIVGGSLQDRTTTGLVSVRPEIKAAIIIFVVIYLVTVTLLCFLSRRVSKVAKGEKRILVAVALCLPFIAVRLIYALIADFANNIDFSLAYGNTTIYLCMAVITEIIVTVIILSFGLTLHVIPKPLPLDSESQKIELRPGNSAPQSL
jgi:magnesium-transporting ATPase (P-type)